MSKSIFVLMADKRSADGHIVGVFSSEENAKGHRRQICNDYAARMGRRYPKVMLWVFVRKCRRKFSIEKWPVDYALEGGAE